MTSFYAVLLSFGYFCEQWKSSFQVQTAMGELSLSHNASVINATATAVLPLIDFSNDSENEKFEQQHYASEYLTGSFETKPVTVNSHAEFTSSRKSKPMLLYVPAFSLPEVKEQANETNSNNDTNKYTSVYRIIENETFNYVNNSTTSNSSNPDSTAGYEQNLFKSKTLPLFNTSLLVNATHFINSSESNAHEAFDLDCHDKNDCIFDNKTHKPSVLQFQDFVSKYNIQESFKNNSFDVDCPVFKNLSLTHVVEIRFSVLTELISRTEILKLFEIRLRQALQDRKCDSIVPVSWIYGMPYVYSWTNASAGHEECNNNVLQAMQDKICNKTNIFFIKTFLPYFKIESVSLIRLGKCTIEPKEIDNTMIIVAVVLTLSILPCIFLTIFKLVYKKLRRRKKEKVLTPRLPVLFDSDFKTLTSSMPFPAAVNFAFEEETKV